VLTGTVIYIHSYKLSQHIKALTLHKITFNAAEPWSRLDGPTHKGKAFTQPLSHNDFGFSFQNLKLHKLSPGPCF